ncbi:MAG: hypothetical protein Q7U52_15730, partial [Hydrogenophaga sp.]|nr:hypothetical protein [Hydrogenophaga sp.]
LQVTEHCGQPVGARAQPVEQHVAQFGRGAVVGLAPEAAQEGLAFAVGKQFWQQSRLLWKPVWPPKPTY